MNSIGKALGYAITWNNPWFQLCRISAICQRGITTSGDGALKAERAYRGSTFKGTKPGVFKSDAVRRKVVDFERAASKRSKQTNTADRT